MVLLLLAFVLPAVMFFPAGLDFREDPSIAGEEAPFVLLTEDGDEQIARTSISTANPVTSVDVGHKLEIQSLDGSDGQLELDVRLLACPDRPRLAASVVEAGEPWTVPRLESDAYALKVSDGERYGSFGLVVGEGPVREDRC
jgi:hypothetical protein